MRSDKKAWDKIFKKGRYFDKPHPDIDEVVGLLKEKSAKKVLDLGCGAGRHTAYLAKEGFDVYATDISERGLKMTESSLEEEGLSAKLQLHDMLKKFPFDDNFFDGLISIQVIHHATHKQIKKIIKEMARVLKSGSLVFVSVAGEREYTPKVGGWKMKKIDKHTYIPLTGLEKGLVHHFFNEEELKEYFSDFDVEKVYIDDTDHLALLGYKK